MVCMSILHTDNTVDFCLIHLTRLYLFIYLSLSRLVVYLHIRGHVNNPSRQEVGVLPDTVFT